jgi:putative membrane protein
VEQRADVVDDREQIIDEIKAGPKEFIKLGLLQSKVTYFIIGGQLSALIIGLISVHITGSNVEDFIDIIVSNVSLWTILIAIFLFYGIALLISVSGSLIKYNNFRLSANNDVLKVEYGLFEKKAFSLRKNKINGVVLEQNLLMRLFRVYSVQVLVIGYGDKSDEEANEQAIIFPIARMDKIKMILQKFLPDFEVNDQLIKSSKKAIKYYFYRFGFVLLLIISVAAFFTKSVPIIVFFSFLIILSVVSKILQYYNSGIYCGKKNVILCFGGYHKNTQIIRTSSIESVRSTGSRFKQKKSITIIGIDFIAPKLKANLTGNNLPLEQYEKLKSVIDY